MKVGVHQGSVLSPLLFIIVLEALTRQFRCGHTSTGNDVESHGRTSVLMTLLS